MSLNLLLLSFLCFHTRLVGLELFEEKHPVEIWRPKWYFVLLGLVGMTLDTVEKFWCNKTKGILLHFFDKVFLIFLDFWDICPSPSSCIKFEFDSWVWNNIIEDFEHVYDYKPFSPSFDTIHLQFFKSLPVVQFFHVINFSCKCSLYSFNFNDFCSGCWVVQWTTIVQFWEN